MKRFDNPVVEAGLAGLVHLYEDRAITPVEAVEAYLSRIERLDPAVGAFVHLDGQGALAAAHDSADRWRRGAPLSPLDGAAVAVKANIAVAGLPWTAGVGAYRDRIAEEDAASVQALKASGAVILGLVNMEEGALGAVTDNPWYGRTHNPWRRDFTAGGSSGGSAAAVAAGLCAAALGTDTLGSVRLPSAYCGVVGHKPTQNLISAEGVTELSWTFDNVGVHARSVQDAALLFAGASRAERELAEEMAVVSGLSLLQDAPLAALDLSGLDQVDGEVAAAFARTMQTASAAGLQIDVLRLDHDFGRLRRLGLLVSEAEGYVVHRAALESNPEGFSPRFRQFVEWGAGQPAHKLAAAYRELGDMAERLREALGPYAGLLLPATPQAAFSFDGEAPASQADFTSLANILGLPATAFPIGLTADGMPLAAQALTWDDETALGLAAALTTPLGAPPPFQG